MSVRFKSASVLAIAAAIGTAAFAQVPRTADGHPDLQGIWTNATITRWNVRPTLKDKPTLTEKEAVAYETRVDGQFQTDRRGATAEQDRDQAYNRLFLDRGDKLARVDGVARTSLIVDPPDGKMPALTPEARKRIADAAAQFASTA